MFVGIVWMSENMRVSDPTYVISSAYGIDGLNVVIASLFFKYISKDWRHLYAIPLFLFGINLVWLCF